MNLEHPALLLLLPLALLPLRRGTGSRLVYSSLSLLPDDPASRWLDRVLRGAGVVALAALLLALAGPYRPERQVERQGQGAEIVLLLDRSRSMDQAFGSARDGLGIGGNYNPYYSLSGEKAVADRNKGEAARRVLTQFVAQRPNDRFGMVVFSTLPMRVLDFTEKPAAVKAAIAAGQVGRGISETDIGLALQEGLAFFEQRPYTGSRILMLVSDGGDHLDAVVRERLATLMQRYRVSLYWIYIRSARSPGLSEAEGLSPENAEAVPEYFLHRYFKNLGVPYRAYEAENPDALERAVADVNRLENLPITYLDTVPRAAYAPLAYGVAAAALLLLSLARWKELHAWR